MADELGAAASQSEEAAAAIGPLADFMYVVSLHPEAFPVTGQMATAIKSRLRKLRGPAQPERKNKRKRTQERKQSFQRRNRQERKAAAEAYNAAREELLRAAEVEENLAARQRAEDLGVVLPESS